MEPVVGETLREMSPGKLGSLPQTEQPLATWYDYEFVRWYALDEEGERYTVTADTVFTKDDTVYAEWKVTPRRLRYNTNNGYPGSNPATGDYWYDSDWITDLNEIQHYTVKNPPAVTNHGYELVGWFVENYKDASGKNLGKVEVAYGDNTLVPNVELDLRFNSIVKAEWKKLDWVTVTFNSDGGSACAPVSVVKGDMANHFPAPTKENNVFLGWYLVDASGAFQKDSNGNDIEVTVLTPINQNITVKAKWESYVKVSFDSDGGTACEAKYVRQGRRLTEWPAPKKNGYVFKGWYLTEAGAEPDSHVIAQPETKAGNDTVINEDMTVMAKWAEQYTVTYNWTDYVDSSGKPVITTETVEKGRTVTGVPGMYRGGVVVEGWYPNEDYTGEPLTSATEINGNVTYYAKWGPSTIVVEEDNIEFQYNIVWTDPSTSELINADDCLSWHVSGSKGGAVEAHAYINFALVKTNGITLQPGSIQLQVPKYVFDSAKGGALKAGVSNDAVEFIPESPYRSKNLGWNYIDMGDYYLLQNTESTENLTLNLKITYKVNNFADVLGARIDSQTGERLDANGNVLLNDSYAPRDNLFNIAIKSGGIDIERTKNLQTAAYKTYTSTTYSASYGKGGASVKRSWNNAWGAKPADADKYYYVVWTHGGFSVSAHGSFKASTAGLFDTTSKQWVPDHYDVVYETPDYVVTRHLYSDLTNNRTTLYKTEKLEGEWKKSGLKEYGEGTIECRIDFTVGDPTPPNPSTSSKAELSASKSRYPYYYTPDYSVGQDQILDDETITFSSYILSMRGPGADRLVQKGDTNLYQAKEYTMVMRDGDSGDITYSSGSKGRRFYLGDNDYRFTRLGIELSNSDGYQDTNGWHEMGNMAYSSWKPVEVWIREKGKTVFYKYTDVIITSGSRHTVILPDNTVGFEIRHTTTYARTNLTVYPTMQILPSSHVKRLVQADYLGRIYSYFYNRETLRR